MTDEQCAKQIVVLQKAARKALRSKESALQFLIDAGIVRPTMKTATGSSSIKTQKK